MNTNEMPERPAMPDSCVAAAIRHGDLAAAAWALCEKLRQMQADPRSDAMRSPSGTLGEGEQAGPDYRDELECLERTQEETAGDAPRQVSAERIIGRWERVWTEIPYSVSGVEFIEFNADGAFPWYFEGAVPPARPARMTYEVAGSFIIASSSAGKRYAKLAFRFDGETMILTGPHGIQEPTEARR